MACFSSGRQGVGVYLVWPLSSAALAASLIKPGVSKSGSPAPKPTTSPPAFFSAAALALTASVIDSQQSSIRSARGNMGSAPRGLGAENPRGCSNRARDVSGRDGADQGKGRKGSRG